MRFSTTIKAVLVSLATLGRAEEDCDAGIDKAPFAPGTVGGEAFPDPADDQVKCVNRWKDGETLVGIKAWSTRTEITGIKFKFDRTGWTDTHGKTVPRSWHTKTGEWNARQVVRVEIWNKKAEALNGPGRIKIYDDKTDEVLFEVGIGDSEIALEPLNDINQGAGVILGAKTRSKDWLSSVEFKVLKAKVIKTQLTAINVTENLDDWNKVENGEQKGIEHVNLDETYYKNLNKVGGRNHTYTFTNSIEKWEEKRIIDQVTNSWTGGLTITVGSKVQIPSLSQSVDFAFKFEYQRQNMGGTEKARIYMKTLTNTQGSGITESLLPPQRAAHCKFNAVSGTFDSAYNGSVEATLADDSKYSYRTTGDVHSVGWVQTSSSCEEIDIKDVPPNAGLRETKEVPPNADLGPTKPYNATKHALRFFA